MHYKALTLVLALVLVLVLALVLALTIEMLHLLSEDLIYLICGYLSIKVLCVLSHTNKYINDTINKNYFYDYCKRNWTHDKKQIVIALARNDAYFKHFFLGDDSWIREGEILVTVCEQGNIRLVDWLNQIYPEIFYTQEIIDAFRVACANGHISVAKKINQLHPSIRRSIQQRGVYEETFLSICLGNQLDVLKWFLNFTSKYTINDGTRFNHVGPTVSYAFVRSCANGNLGMTKLLQEKYGASKKTVESAFMIACENGHLEILKFLTQEFNQIPFVANQEMSDLAAVNGHLEVTKWLHNKYDLIPDINLVCTSGHLDIAQWIHQIIFESTGNRSLLECDMNKLFRLACENGRQNIIDWLIQLYPSHINFNYKKCYAFRKACINGHLGIAQWLYGFIPEEMKNEIDFGKLFQKACKNGHIKMIDWLQKISTIDIQCDNNYAFRMACAGGHLDIAQYLRSECPTININACDNFAFYFACAYGHLNVAQWLYAENRIEENMIEENMIEENRIEENKIEVNNFSELLYLVSFGNHLNILKWLLKENTSLILPVLEVEETERALVIACECGHLQMAQFIYKLWPTLNYPKKRALLSLVRMNGHNRMYKWLCQIHAPRTISV